MSKNTTTTPTPYRQWVAAGRKYHKGLSLFNQVKGFDVLKKTLARGPSVYNNGKLDLMLRKHFDQAPAPAHAGAPPPPKAQQHRAKHQARAHGRTPAPAPTPAVSSSGVENDSPPGGGDETPADAGDDDPRDEPTEYTPRTWKARPFSELPEPLKELRISIIRDYRKRTQMHAELCLGIADKKRCQQLCRDIVETTDRINAHWAIEEAWTKDGTMPHLPQDEAARIDNADVFALQRELTNQVAPQLTRLNHKLKLDDSGKKKLTDEERTAAEMRRGQLEHTKGLIKQRLLDHQKQRDQ